MVIDSLFHYFKIYLDSSPFKLAMTLYVGINLNLLIPQIYIALI